MSQIVDVGIVNSDVNFVLNTGLFMLLWAIGSELGAIVSSYCSARASLGFGRDIRASLYEHITSLSAPQVDDFGTSSLITRTTNDIQQLERFVEMFMLIAFMSPVMFVGAAIMAYMKSPQLSVIIFIAIPIILALVFVIMRLAMPLLKSLQRRIDKLNRITREGLSGIRVIRSFRREAYEEKRFAGANKELADTNVAVVRRIALLMPGIMIILNGATICIVYFAAILIDQGSFAVGDMMALVQYAMQVLISVLMLSGIFMIWPRAAAAALRLEEVLKTEPIITNSDNCVSLNLRSNDDSQNAGSQNEDFLKAPHTISFEQVDFSFPNASEKTLANINFELKPSKTYAIIGSTGSGKSSIINLLLRFFDPTSGAVAIDNINIKDLDQQVLRLLISYVPQKTTLFSGTLAQNISYGNKEATQQDIEQAAKNACAYDFIMQKKDGFETKITQSQTGLSGGQKQRIAIARALCKPAMLYIFDDSFSALDFKTDALVRQNLARVTKNATVLIVAQRVAAAMDADEVIVLDKGCIVGKGTHDELLETCDIYKEIVASQIEDEHPIDSNISMGERPAQSSQAVHDKHPSASVISAGERPSTSGASKGERPSADDAAADNAAASGADGVAGDHRGVRQKDQKGEVQ